MKKHTAIFRIEVAYDPSLTDAESLGEDLSGLLRAAVGNLSEAELEATCGPVDVGSFLLEAVIDPDE